MRKKKHCRKGFCLFGQRVFADTINVHAGRRFVNGKKWVFPDIFPDKPPQISGVYDHGDQFYITAGMVGDGVAGSGGTDGNVTGRNNLCFTVIAVGSFSF